MPSLTIHGGEGSQQVTPGYQKVCSEDLMFLSFNRMMMLGPVMSCGGQQQDVEEEIFYKEENNRLSMYVYVQSGRKKSWSWRGRLQKMESHNLADMETW